MQPILFRSTHRPRFSEIDPYGHLNTKHYFDYFSENRMIGHREILGLDIKEFTKLPFGIVTRSVEIEFLKPILIEQQFEVISWTEAVSSTSVVVLAELVTASGNVAAKAKTVLICIDKKTGKPMPWDTGFVQKFFHADEPVNA